MKTIYYEAGVYTEKEKPNWDWLMAAQGNSIKELKEVAKSLVGYNYPEYIGKIKLIDIIKIETIETRKQIRNITI